MVLTHQSVSFAGSLLVATSAEEARSLEAHVEELAAAGVEAEFLTATGLRTKEPSLKVGYEGGAAFVPGDGQIDAALAVALVRKLGSTSTSKGLMEVNGIVVCLRFRV